MKTNIAPLRGWGPRDARLVDHHPHDHWRTLTFLVALRIDQNPIEQVFGKLKHFLREATSRTKEAVASTIAAIRDWPAPRLMTTVALLL